ncbi:alanyl-tRNA editing protein [Natrialbaceae archaeon A-gly3]
MTGQRAAAEPYATRFETEVTAIDGRNVWLETTHFYAESGGQPADRGTIGNETVDDVRLVDGEPVHVLAEEPSFRAGHRVLCSIDWAFRMYCMRAHTASHVLYGAARRCCEDLGYGGFDISEERVRIDLETATEIDDETLVELDELVNRAVWESRPVSWESVQVAQAREREEIAFNEATEEAFSKGQVRVVTIGGPEDNGSANGSSDPWDVAACGGTHVRNTREIGPVTVCGRSNPGEGLTRIELAVGPAAIEHKTAEKRATLATTRALGATVEDVPAELEGVLAKRERFRDDLEATKRELLEARVAAAEPFERDGDWWLVTDVGGVSANDATEVVREVAGDRADVVIVVGEDGSTFAVVGTDGSPAATTVVDDLTATFGGGGGGSDRVAQAGGLEASPEELIAELV